MKQLYTYLTLILLLGLSACQDKNTPDLPEITVGDGSITMINVDKNSTIDLKITGGNGKFTATVQDTKIATAKIEGEYIKIKGVQYGETKLVITSHDKRKEMTIRVDRPEFHLGKTEVTLYPGETDRVVNVTGGGDDAKMETDDPEMAIIATWDAKSNNLKITAKHEGEAIIKFISNDDKPAKELKVIVKAEDANKLAEKIGFYNTSSSSLHSIFSTVMSIYREGKMVWICGSTSMNISKKRLQMKPVVSPKKGDKLNVHLSFVNLDKYKSQAYNLIVESVLTEKKLVVLRGQGFKIVAPYDEK